MATPTSTRLDEDYVIWYVNVARLLVQGIIPFISLSFLNYRIYWVMKRRANMINRPLVAKNSSSQPNVTGAQLTAQQKKANEAQQAVVLFVIVLLFFLCHALRFVINIHELFNLNALKQAIGDPTNDCFSYVAFTSVSVSNCLMTLNASVNFFIYAFTSSTFREVVKKKYGKCVIFKWAIDIMGHCSCTSRTDNIENGIFSSPNDMHSKFKNLQNKYNLGSQNSKIFN